MNFARHFSLASLLFAVLALGSLPASPAAAAEMPRAAVKVQSYVCTSQGRIDSYKQGSGTLIRKGDDIFVLTSDHVLYPQSRGPAMSRLCYVVSTEDRRTFSAQFVAANFLQDIALLKVVEAAAPTTAGSLAALALPVEALKTPALTPNESLTFKGFPFAAPLGGSVSVYNASVIDGKSHRTGLVVPYIVEMAGLSEYGLSGGAVFDGSGDLVGILSHQILRVHEGQPTTADELSAKQGPVITLAVPSDVVKDWLDDLWAGERKADLRYDQDLAVESSINGVSLGGLLFQENNCLTGMSLRLGESGIGGHGVGIGGSGPASASFGQCVLSVTRRSAGNPDDLQPWPWDDLAPLNMLIASVVGAGTSGTVYIRGVMKDADVVPAETLLQVVALLRDGYVPIISTTKPQTRPVGSSLRNQGQLEDMMALFDGIAVQNRAAFIKRAADFDRGGPAAVAAAWTAGSPQQRIYDYIAVSHFAAQQATKRAVYRLSALWSSAFQESHVFSDGRILTPLRPLPPPDDWTLIAGGLTLKFLNDLWTVSTPAEKKSFWDVDLATDYGKMNLFIALSAFTPPGGTFPADFWTVSGPFMSRVAGEWMAAVAANRQAAYWKDAGIGRRYWIMYTIGTVYKAQYPEPWQKLQVICPDLPSIAIGVTKN